MSTINPWLEERLDTPNPDTISIIVEVDPDEIGLVAGALQNLGLVPQAATFGRFIPVTVPKQFTQQVAAIPGVVLVHYDMPVSLGVNALVAALPTFPDPLLGDLRLSSIEIPRVPLVAPLSFSPIGALTAGPLSAFAASFGGAQIKQSGFEMFPTSVTRRMMGVPAQSQHDLVVAVLDTGVFFPSFNWGANVRVHSTTGELPIDLQGHGQHVSTTAFGRKTGSRFGELQGVSQPGMILGVKVLTNAGFGLTSGIFAGIEWAVNQGAKVINMSLGGPVQGSAREDPYARLFRSLRDDVLVVVAAGNSGPEGWTIESPGISPDVLTVGAYSPMYDGVADFSSRGPSSTWAQEHPDEWQRDLDEFGQDVIKPDVIAPGGGPVNNQSPIDLIYSGVSGWSDGMYDLLVDGAEGMRGTSMASPHAAGLLALAVAQGHVRTAADVKRRMTRGEKSEIFGYGMLTWSRIAAA